MTVNLQTTAWNSNLIQTKYIYDVLAVNGQMFWDDSLAIPAGDVTKPGMVVMKTMRVGLPLDVYAAVVRGPFMVGCQSLDAAIIGKLGTLSPPSNLNPIWQQAN